MIGVIIIIAVALLTIIMIVGSYHLDYGLPFTKRRKLFKYHRRIFELEWEMNIGGVRQWKVERIPNSPEWKAHGPHPYTKGLTQEYKSLSWYDALDYATEQAKKCAQGSPRDWCA